MLENPAEIASRRGEGGGTDQSHAELMQNQSVQGIVPSQVGTLDVSVVSGQGRLVGDIGRIIDQDLQRWTALPSRRLGASRSSGRRRPV
jgi:hypothetical protein